MHPNVECDGCGQCPIRGDRYSSKSRPNYDLCSACHTKLEAAAAGPFRKMLPGALQMAGSGVVRGTSTAGVAAAGSSGSGSEGVAQVLLLWVWRYFTSQHSAGVPSGSTGDAGSMMAAAVAGAGAGIRTAASGSMGWPTSAVNGGGMGSRAGPGSAKRLRLEQTCVRLSGKSPLYFQVCGGWGAGRGSLVGLS